MPSLKGNLSILLLKRKRQGYCVLLTFEGKTPAFLITGQDALWKESAFGTNSKRSQYYISAGGLKGRSHLMWCMHHLNGCELLGLEPGALSVQRSAGECALLPFLGKLMDPPSPPNRNHRED